MNIVSTKLPPLPQVPDGGRGRLKVDIDYIGPATVETRLGSIPADYDSYSGWAGSERVYFRDHHREASNPYGRSVDIWRAQPTYNPDGTPRRVPVTETVVAEPKSPLTTPLKWGAVGAAGGGLAGALLGFATGLGPAMGAALGAGVGATAGGIYGYRDAETDRVRLEWQETNITEKDLVGYLHEVTEDRRQVCYGHGKDRHCRWETEDYEHEFTPLIQERTVGTYHRPIVVHFKENR